MLATRAAADPELKELMKVVASSKASQEQLKLFQGHIDELNEIIRRQEADKSQRAQHQPLQNGASTPTQTPPRMDGAKDQATPGRTNTPMHPSSPRSGPQTPYPPPPGHPTNAHLPPVAIRGPPGKSGPLGPPAQVPYPQYAPPLPRPEPRIKHIVVEFTTPASGTQSASQDRWLFPKYAVLDTPLSGRGLEMVCSFFVIRKGSQINAVQNSVDGDAIAPSRKWRANEEYYQPVTMTLKAPVHRTLETIARAAKPLPEVQAHMNQVMEQKKRAPVEYLVTRLPKDKEVTVGAADADMSVADGWEFVDSGVEVGSPEDDELKDFYGV